MNKWKFSLLEFNPGGLLNTKIDDEIARAKSEEKRIETKLDKEIDRSTQEDEDIHDELDGIKEELESLGPVKVADYGLRDNKVWVKFEFGLIIQMGITIVMIPKQWQVVSLPIPFSGDDTFTVFGSDNALYTANNAHLVTGAPASNSSIALYCHADFPTTTGWLAVGF